MIRDYYPAKQFRFWCQKVLPLVYDDSLSYYEVLAKVVKFLNDMSDTIASTFTEIDNTIKEYTLEFLNNHPEIAVELPDYSVTTIKLANQCITSDKINSGLLITEEQIDALF